MGGRMLPAESLPVPMVEAMTRPIPLGYHSVTPHLIVSDGAKAIRFYERALGATEVYRLKLRTGKLVHAELQIGDSRVMLSDDVPEWGAKSARAFGGCPIVLSVYTDDVALLAERFVQAGGTIIHEVRDQFYGDRAGQFQDPEGYRWTLAQRIENVHPEEMARRMATLEPSRRLTPGP